MSDDDALVGRCRAAKARTGVTYAQLAEAVGQHPVWVASALERQNPLSAEQAQTVGRLLGLGEDDVVALQVLPYRGSLPACPPTDPLVYRLHEVVTSYGTTLKAVIQEEFGDGIMSAIDVEIDVRRRADPKGDRVVVTVDGKFLPFRRW